MPKTEFCNSFNSKLLMVHKSICKLLKCVLFFSAGKVWDVMKDISMLYGC